MMSLQNDMELMAESLNSEGVAPATHKDKNDYGLEAHGEDKEYRSNVPDLVDTGRRLGPIPTLSGNGGVNGGAQLQPNTDWSSGYGHESGRGPPHGSGESNASAHRGAT